MMRCHGGYRLKIEQSHSSIGSGYIHGSAIVLAYLKRLEENMGGLWKSLDSAGSAWMRTCVGLVST